MYREKTKQKVLDFIKAKKKTYIKDIIRLGTDQNKIDQKSLASILEDLETEGKIERFKIANINFVEFVDEI